MKHHLRIVQADHHEEFWHVFLDGVELTDPADGTDDLDIAGYYLGLVFEQLETTVEFVEP